MSFDEVQGAAVVRTDKEPFEALAEFVNSELDEDEGSSVERARIADIALTVGIIEEERVEELGEDRAQFNLGSLDKHDVMKTIIEERHPELSGKELRGILQEYLAGGTQVIGKQIGETGVFQYHDYLPGKK